MTTIPVNPDDLRALVDPLPADDPVACRLRALLPAEEPERPEWTAEQLDAVDAALLEVDSDLSSDDYDGSEYYTVHADDDTNRRLLDALYDHGLLGTLPPVTDSAEAGASALSDTRPPPDVTDELVEAVARERWAGRPVTDLRVSQTRRYLEAERRVLQSDGGGAARLQERAEESECSDEAPSPTADDSGCGVSPPPPSPRTPTEDDYDLLGWLRNIDWAVTTEHDCWGTSLGEGETERYALYDAGDDDPPLAVFAFRDDAERVAEVLARVAESGLVPTVSEPPTVDPSTPLTEEWVEVDGYFWCEVCDLRTTDPAFHRRRDHTLWPMGYRKAADR